jgi:predicted nucleotidyltransferase
MPKLAEIRLNQDDVRDSFAFHDQLNPDLWDTKTGEMKLEIRVAMLRAAEAFRDFLDLQHLEIVDIIFTGSNAAFNYTKLSDLDIHIITDYASTSCPSLAENFFTTKKTLWNRDHDIRIKRLPVEMYVEDTANPVTANGVYSLLRGHWIKQPEARIPKWDDSAVLVKAEALADEIEGVLDGNQEALEEMAARLRRLRRCGLAAGGEFSVENMAFKALRNLGFLERLSQARRDAQDRSLSLETQIR